MQLLYIDVNMVAMEMRRLVSKIAEKHRKSGIIVHAPAAGWRIARFEEKTGIRLPDDFAAFYTVCNGFECEEDLFNMKSIEEITAFEPDYGEDWFTFSEYMISSDMWQLRKKPDGESEIINPGNDTGALILTSSLAEFLERFLRGNVFDPGGLYHWHDEVRARRK